MNLSICLQPPEGGAAAGRERLRGRVSFRPVGWGFVPISGAQEAVELEADLEGLYQEDPSELMGGSRGPPSGGS